MAASSVIIPTFEAKKRTKEKKKKNKEKPFVPVTIEAKLSVLVSILPSLLFDPSQHIGAGAEGRTDSFWGKMDDEKRTLCTTHDV